MATFRVQLQGYHGDCHSLLRIQSWRGFADAAFDVALCLAMVAVSAVNAWALPVAVLVIGNRQRALGNLLHDGAHRNLSRKAWLNDLLVNMFVAPLIFVDLRRYRDVHYQHHLNLGHAVLDPDRLAPVPGASPGWARNYVFNVMQSRAWRGSVAGHLLTGEVPLRRRLCIVFWWVALLAALLSLCGARFGGFFALIWMTARATVFHMITVFREMCDHFGLPSGGVVCCTRDVVSISLMSYLIHPRNNGYHLTHHLLPAIPYYRLREAQRIFAAVPMYRHAGNVFESYLCGERSVVRGWCARGDL